MSNTASEGYRDFEDLVKEVRMNDPAILHRVMEADGVFQTRRTTLNDTTRAVIDLNAAVLSKRTSEDLPTIVFSWGKCRVGSTALTNLFGIAGIPAYYNPIKTAVRHFLLHGQGEAWKIPSRSEHAVVFAKNMSGPYHLVDCTVNSLQILVEAGYPASRIELLVLERDPYRALDSWINIWGHLIPVERLVQHYVISALNAIRIKDYASKVGVRVSHYIYEASRIPDNTVNKLFRRLGIEQLYNGNVVENWNEKGALESLQSKIIFPKLPGPLQHIDGMHASEPRYLYKERSTDRISPAHRSLIERTGVIERYIEAASSFVQEFNLNLFDREKIFEGTPVGIPRPAGMERRSPPAWTGPDDAPLRPAVPPTSNKH